LLSWTSSFALRHGGTYPLPCIELVPDAGLTMIGSRTPGVGFFSFTPDQGWHRPASVGRVAVFRGSGKDQGQFN
jgi:hypothetical protein